MNMQPFRVKLYTVEPPSAIPVYPCCFQSAVCKAVVAAPVPSLSPFGALPEMPRIRDPGVEERQFGLPGGGPSASEMATAGGSRSNNVERHGEELGGLV